MLKSGTCDNNVLDVNRKPAKGKMTTATMTEEKQGGTKQCKYCRDRIPVDAVICKSCYEPQDFWDRATRFMSTVLAAFISVGSLYFAYLQHEDAKQANKEASDAKAGETAQVTASQDAMRQLSSLYYGGHTNASGASVTPRQRQQREQMLLSPEFKTIQNTSELQKKLATNPANVDLRKEILMRQFLANP